MPFALDRVAHELNLREDELIVQAIHTLLQRNLHQIESQIFEIKGQYGVGSVEEMDERYRDGSLDEHSSWRDFQRLDHLEYKRDRLVELLKQLA